MAEFNIAIDKLLTKEGGYVNDPHDPGGETKYGISKRSYPHLRIKELTKQDACKIYRRDYWDRLDLSETPSQEFAEQLFESAVHMGTGTTKTLVGMLKKDLSEEESLMLQFQLLEVQRYREICNRRKASRRYLLGWLNRIME